MGAAIAAAILFFLFRRQKNRQAPAYRQSHIPYNGGTIAPEKGPTVVASAVPSSVDNYLPQPVEDDAITGELSKIRDNIKNHVRSYYHFEAIRAGDINVSGLAGIATATGLRSSAVADLLSNPPTRSEAIRLFIAWVALSKCEDNTNPSLLPEELSNLAVQIPGKDGQNAGK